MKKLYSLLFFFLLWANGFAQSANQLNVNASVRYQTMEGMGAAVAYFENWLTAHPNKEEIYQLIYKELGIDILRIRNVHGYTNSSITNWVEIVKKAETSLGHPVNIMISSWSPPAYLKRDGLMNGGTLIKKNGVFAYQDFAQWWYESLQAYAQSGIVPKYISMQNEPDYENAGWETCLFKDIESTDYPAYGKALQALHSRLANMSERPRIIGPEVIGTGYNTFQNYIKNLDNAHLDAYAYHLYHGGDPNNPDSFKQSLEAIRVNYQDKPNIMSEFSGGGWFNTAWLVQNTLTHANASAYLYWDLIWGREYGKGGLVSLENPWNTSAWTTAKGYVVNADYYGFKHFSRHINPGDVRVDAVIANENIKVSAYTNAANDNITLIVLNTGANSESIHLALSGFTGSEVEVIQSVESNFYNNLGKRSISETLSLPAKSISTLTIKKGTTVPVSGIKVDPASASIVSGSILQLKASVFPDNAGNKTVTWVSDNKSVATVSATGLVTGVAAGIANITATTQEGGFIASSKITVTSGQSSCTFGTPAATALASVSKTFSKAYVLGSGGPNLSHVTNFTINWSLEHNGLWQLSFNTNNGQPNWYIDLRTVATWKFNQAQPDITFTNSGIAGLDGAYWVTTDNGNFVLVSKTKGFSIYFSNAATAPACGSTNMVAQANTSESININQADFNVFPNPATDFIEISGGDLEHASIQLFDLQGRELFAQKINTVVPEMRVDMRQLAPGIYILQVKSLKKSFTRKIIKSD